MRSNTIVIKKYGNRRLYDTAASRYINLDDIAALIRGGTEVQVIDAKSHRDLTRVVLTQIITEDAKDKPTGLPLELLRQLIVATDQAGRDFIMWYLKSAFEAYQSVQSAMQSRLGDVQSAVLSPLQTVRRFLGVPDEGAAAEVEQLRKRVAELEGSLQSASRAHKAPAGARKKSR